MTTLSGVRGKGQKQEYHDFLTQLTGKYYMSDNQTTNAQDPFDSFAFNDPFSLLGNIDSANVIAFFGLISRIEYAVMVQGFVDNRAGQRMNINWIAFAESMKNKLLALGSEKVNQSVRYLCVEPPLQYMNTAEWKKRNYKHGLALDSLAILAAKDVRNNLFHGIKLNNPEHARNNELIEAAIVVFRGCLMACPELNVYYNS